MFNDDDDDLGKCYNTSPLVPGRYPNSHSWWFSQSPRNHGPTQGRQEALALSSAPAFSERRIMADSPSMGTFFLEKTGGWIEI